MTLQDTIHLCIFEHRGLNKEFALFYFPKGEGDAEDRWQAEIGNLSLHVMLGEASGELEGNGRTALAAVLDLLTNIRGK